MNVNNPFWVAERWLILRILEPISHRTQRLSGITCFHLAYALILLSLIMACLVPYLLYEYRSPKTWVAHQPHLWIGAMFVSGFAVYRLLSAKPNNLQAIEQHAWRVLMQGTRNPYLFTERASFFFLIIPTFNFIGDVMQLDFTFRITASSLFLLFYWAGLVFAACTPLPKEPSLLAKAYSKLKGTLSQLGGNRDPTPEPTQ